jgi:GTP:adenosylcobinamide-phosphate guanylyltransferase
VPAAVVLAGGAADPRLAPDLPNKAFLALGGRPVVARVVDALRACVAVDRIVAVGPPDALAAVLGGGVDVVAERGGMLDNIAAAIERLGDATHIMPVASDLPLLDAATLADFLGRCGDDADFFYPIVPRAVMEARFPGARKTFVTVTDGTFCGGSILLFRTAVVDRVRPFMEQVVAARKKPWLLAQLFGWATVMKFASGRLSIEEMQARAEAITGFRARAVVIERPELALDVDADRPENLEALRAALDRAAPAD